jgi:branched-chain amino acid transport system permease protein
VETFLSFTVIGIVAGAIYAVTAMGLVVTYTTTGVFNFAQGAVGMVAAFSYWELTQSYHWPVVLALVVVLLVEAPLLGALVEFIFMRRIYGASADRSLMVTLGVLLIMVGVATAVWGQQTLRIVPPFFEGHEVTIFGVVVTYQQLLIVIVAVVIALGLRLYFMNFRSGVAMRAVVDDPELLALAGVAPYRVSRRGWMLGFMLAGLAGVLLAPTVGSTGLNIDTLTLLVVNGYAAAVVGRLRSLPWTFGGGIALGLADAYATGYLPGHIPAALVEQIATIIPAVFLFVALLVVPSAMPPTNVQGRLRSRPTTAAA